MRRTQYSQKGLDFVTLFAAKFANSRINGYRPLLREPIAESTGGGKQALQHMIFEPMVAGDPVLTVGSVNVATKTAKLRTFDCLRQLFVMRFGSRAFVVDKAQYQAFFDKAMEFMKRQGLQVDIETRPPEVASGSMPPPRREGSGTWLLVGIVIVIGAVVAAGYLVLTGRVAF